MAQGYNWDRVIPIPWSSSSGSSSSDSDTSSLLGDTMEDIPWASLLTPLPRPISPLREPVPPHGRDLEMAQGYNWDRVIPIPWSSSSGSSSGDSDTSSLLGDSMDEGYTWTSLLVPNPDRPDSPRLILRRVPAPASPSGSPSSGSDTSSLLGDTMEDIPWASLLAPLPRPISPLREPVPPCGRDPEVGASDPPPAPGKPVEAGPSKGPVAPGKPKSLPTGPKPRFGQLFIYSITQKSTPLNPVLDDVRIYQIYCISPPPHPVFLPCEDLS
ncbi:hypothetical protein ABVT39_024405 [Epinephelus coioides]